MAFSFRRQNRVGHQVREIAREQIDKALHEARAGDDFDVTVHALRRRGKKMRGLLRLVEPHFKTFRTENKAVREAASALGDSRDAVVVIETFDQLIANTGGDLSSEAVASARHYLVQRSTRISDTKAPKAVLQDFAEALEAVGKRVDNWRFTARGEKLVLEGFGLTYDRMRQAARKAWRSGDAHDLHEWRKHAKSHLYHVTLLTPAAPQILRARRQALEQLGDYLGDHHNLAVLSEVLHDPSSPIDDDFVPALDALIAERQQTLAVEARTLGRQLTIEKPKALERQMAGYWALLDAGA